MPSKPVVQPIVETEPVDINALFSAPSESAEMDDPFKGVKETSSSSLLSDLLATPIDADALAEHQQELLLPTGTYTWLEGKCTIRDTYNDADMQPTDLAQRRYAVSHEVKHNRGRLYLRVAGIVVNRDTQKKGRFDNWTFSPDMRYRRNRDGSLYEPTEFDMAYQAYLTLTTFYFAKCDRNPLHEGEVFDLVKSGLYQMYLRRGNDGKIYMNQIQEIR